MSRRVIVVFPFPYSHVLKSGKTVIQHIYDSHFSGVERAEGLVQLWDFIKDKIDSERFIQVRERLIHQVEHAGEWRDIVNTYFYRKSGIADDHGRLIY